MKPAPKHTLLVVDDESDVGDSVYDLLRREFNVLRARSAEEGCRLMQEHEVHLIMTDQRMPQITGVEFLSKARLRHPRAVRLLFTGYADLESVIAAINQGHVFQFIKKPWRPEDLEAAVREAAAEYDRLVDQAEEIHRLRGEVQALHERLAALEAEVARLRQPGGP
jgi:response regulator RpfG family c-di-GMP phosphodiesterase